MLEQQQEKNAMPNSKGEGLVHARTAKEKNAKRGVPIRKLRIHRYHIRHWAPRLMHIAANKKALFEVGCDQDAGPDSTGGTESKEVDANDTFSSA